VEVVLVMYHGVVTQIAEEPVIRRWRYVDAETEKIRLVGRVTYNPMDAPSTDLGR